MLLLFKENWHQSKSKNQVLSDEIEGENPNESRTEFDQVHEYGENDQISPNEDKFDQSESNISDF